MQELNNTIRKLNIEKKNDDKRYQDINSKIKVHAQLLKSVEGLKQGFEFIMQDMHEKGQTQLFLSKTLPVLIHLQISEALERTVGDDYKRKIYEYENDKTSEIDKYIKKHSSVKCVKFMHEKLLTYIKFMAEHNKGAVTFTYGEDVHCDMSLDECEYMNSTYEIGIQRKADAIAN